MKKVKTPAPTKTAEREFGEVMAGMVELMGRIFKNQTIEELNKSTVDKFADAQIGNYAVIFTSLAKKAKRKLLKRFSDDRIEKFVKAQLSKVDKRNQDLLYARLAEKMGIDPLQLAANEGLNSTKNALILETAQWAKKLRDETLELYVADTLRSMSLGKPLDEVVKEFTKLESKRRDHAKFIARNQIGNYNSLMTKMRAQKLGIKKAIWVTAGDERVRKCHQVRDGKEFNLDEGLYSSCDGETLLPGVDYQCRCTYELVIEDDE